MLIVLERDVLSNHRLRNPHQKITFTYILKSSGKRNLENNSGKICSGQKLEFVVGFNEGMWVIFSHMGQSDYRIVCRTYSYSRSSPKNFYGHILGIGTVIFQVYFEISFIV